MVFVNGKKVDVNINLNVKNLLDPKWKSSGSGKSLSELKQNGQQFIIYDGKNIPIKSKSINEIYINSVPLKDNVVYGAGLRMKEVERILAPKGKIFQDGVRIK